MRLSATQAATGALTAAVVAGLLLLPGQLLGTDSGDGAAITLPVTTDPASVQAAPVAIRVPARKPVSTHAPEPRQQPVRVATLTSQPVRTVRIVPHTSVTAPRTVAIRPALLQRIVRADAVRAALARRTSRPAKKPTAAPVTTTTTTSSSSRAPAPAAAPAPAETSASTAPTTVIIQPTIVAGTEQPAPAAATDDGLHPGDHDHPHRTAGRSPWDTRRGDGGRARGR